MSILHFFISMFLLSGKAWFLTRTSPNTFFRCVLHKTKPTLFHFRHFIPFSSFWSFLSPLLCYFGHFGVFVYFHQFGPFVHFDNFGLSVSFDRLVQLFILAPFFNLLIWAMHFVPSGYIGPFVQFTHFGHYVHFGYFGTFCSI